MESEFKRDRDREKDERYVEMGERKHSQTLFLPEKNVCLFIYGKFSNVLTSKSDRLNHQVILHNNISDSGQIFQHHEI